MHRTQAEVEVSAEEKKTLNVRVKGEDPVQAVSALYSNFLAVSRVGTDVQFEFIFLDLNVMAGMLEELKKAEKPSVPDLTGKTVAKIVMPGLSVKQLRQHFENVFDSLEAELAQKNAKPTSEGKDDRRTKSG